MKQLLIIPVIVFFAGFASAYAEINIDGTTISGSSDANLVTLKIEDRDGILIWQKAMGVDKNFEIEMPILEPGNYILFAKHGNIGGSSESIEFTYSGTALVDTFELEIELPTSAGEDFSLYAERNESTNFQNMRDYVFSSNEPIRALEVIVVQMDAGYQTANTNLDTVQRWTSDGQETLEYGIFWTELRAYNDIKSLANQILDLIDDGMSLESAFDFFNYVIDEPEEEISVKEPDVEEIEQTEIEIKQTEPELEQIECEAEICVKECNTMPNCTVTWQPKEPDPEPEIDPEPKELGIASFVDETKDPQSYVDRYNSEASYKEWFDKNFPEYSSIYQAVGLSVPIPDWVKGVFTFWTEDKISDDELKNAIRFLVNSGIIIL